MAAVYSHSHSPWDPDRASLRAHVGNPMTPVHSPHHSLASSASSRTPIHTLTIHEYRKQQHTPTLARKGTPPGKTLRRKPAALALNDIERAASVPPSTWSDYGPPQRSLHFSQSAHQLKSRPLPFQQQTQPELPFRAQTTEPHQQTGSISSLSTASSSSKVRYFNSRKRLPRPPATTGLVTIPTPNANVKSTQARQQHPAELNLSAEPTPLVDAQTTTPHSLALSRFPTPPYQPVSPLSPLHDESESTYLNSQNFAATKPATPPATPATIHYRGTSFDLVNPRDSLPLHDIVTPSRDLDSGDYFAVPTSDDEFPEMAPKRAMYGDFRTAHAGILKRPSDSPYQSDVDLPIPPTPAALSPNSSSYTSPMYDADSADIPSPLFTKRTPARESRFSLKGLTRSLTQKLGKGPEKPEEELRDMRSQNLSTGAIRMDLDFPRPLDLPLSMPEISYAPVRSMSPTTQSHLASSEHLPAFSPRQDEAGALKEYSVDRYEVQPLASMVPDDYSTSVGGNGTSQLPYSEGGSLANPYYDNIGATNRSSSIYTGDYRRASHQHGLRSKRNSYGNPLAEYSFASAEYLTDEHSPYTVGDNTSPSKKMLHASTEQADPEADAISTLIDEYNPQDKTETASRIPREETAVVQGPTSQAVGANQEASNVDTHQQSESASSLNELESGMHQASAQDDNAGFSVRYKFSQSPGLPPHAMPPLASAWGHKASFTLPSPSGKSGITARDSTNSYGNTRDLLQVSRYGALVQPGHAQKLEPSSSYSQPGIEPIGPSSSYSQPETGPAGPSSSSLAEARASNTPQEALDHAEQIFQGPGDPTQGTDEIPAMWSRRHSGSQLLGNSVTNRSPTTRRVLTLRPLYDIEGAAPQEDAEWETIGGNSILSRNSLDSIANYSSSEGSPGGGICVNSGGLLTSWVNQPQPPTRPNYYYHPSPIGSHAHPFRSSPPELNLSGMGAALGTSSSPPASEQFASSTAPGSQNFVNRENGPAERSNASLPKKDLYAFSDKVTKELLASGPSETILVDEMPVDRQRQNQDPTSMPSFPRKDALSSSSPGLGRYNTVVPFSTVASRDSFPRAHRVTNSRKTASSIANTIRSGVRLNSGIDRQSQHSEYTGFYAAPFPATGSVTRISQPRLGTGSRRSRTASQTSLFPSSRTLRESQEFWPSDGSRQQLTNSTTFVRNSRRTSRSAVHSQTRLREMFLAPDVRSITSSRTNITHFMGDNRPSTSNTITPLCSSYDSSLGQLPTASRNTIVPSRSHIAHSRSTLAQRYSPHLLCVERKPNAEDEARRRQLSWLIFAGFCVLPPCIILFRFFGDDIIASLTEGHLHYCTPKSKRTAIIAGITVNIGLVVAIIVPVLIAHAVGSA